MVFREAARCFRLDDPLHVDVPFEFRANRRPPGEGSDEIAPAKPLSNQADKKRAARGCAGPKVPFWDVGAAWIAGTATNID